MRSKIFRLACLMLLVLAIGCGTIELYQNLTEDEANEMMVLLSQNNIKAHKKKVIAQNEVSYLVQVKESDMVRARELLIQQNLPRRKELGLTGVYKEKGLIPTPDEQKARYLLALKGEIINSLERIPQVVDADVVLNIPTKDEFAGADKQRLLRPTASVVVRIKSDGSVTDAVTESKIQQFVASAVEGLNPRDVAVIISYSETGEGGLKPGDVRTLPSQLPPVASLPGLGGTPQAPVHTQELMGLNLDSESKTRLKVYLLVFFLLLVVLSTALIVVIIQGSRMRRTLAALRGPAGERPAIDGQVLDEGGPPRLGGGGGAGENL